MSRAISALKDLQDRNFTWSSEITAGIRALDRARQAGPLQDRVLCWLIEQGHVPPYIESFRDLSRYLFDQASGERKFRRVVFVGTKVELDSLGLAPILLGSHSTYGDYVMVVVRHLPGLPLNGENEPLQVGRITRPADEGGAFRFVPIEGIKATEEGLASYVDSLQAEQGP